MPTPSHVLVRTVSETGGFRYIARLAPVASPRGTLSFTLSSVWRDAKDPDAERRVVQLDLDAAAVRRLGELFRDGLSLLEARSTDIGTDVSEASHG
jgi:hypothetical protein